MRVAIDISDDRLERLDALARRRNLTRDEAFQRGIDRLLAEAEPKPVLTREEEDALFDRVFGSWKHLNIDGLEWQQKLRAEWDEPTTK